MTDEPIRKAVFEAVRAELIQHEQAEHSLPATHELYRGYPFYKGSLEMDAVLWIQSSALPRLKGAKRIGRALSTLHRLNDNVNGEFAANAAEAARSLLREGGVTPGIELVLDDVFRRCTYYSWQSGYQYVAADVAVCAYDLATRAREVLPTVRYWQTMVTALASSMAPGPRGQRDRNRGRERALARMIYLGINSKEVHLAEQAAGIEGREGIRDHIEGQFRKLADLDAGLALAEGGNIEPAGLDDVDAFMVEPALPSVPSLVVVGSLDHLPEKKYDKSAPRNEFGDLAERPLPLVRTPDLAEASAALRNEFPWLSAVTDRILEGVVGKEAVVFPSAICLVGAVGAGKSQYARAIARVLNLPLTEVPMGGSADSSYGGTSRQWSTGRACTVLQSIKRAGVANPCVVLDELDKASANRFNGSALDVVLSQVEPGSRKAFFDPFLEAPVDLSAVTFIATVNDTRPLKGPLLDRFLVLACPDPGPEDLDAVVRGILQQVRESSGVDPRFVPDLDHVEISALRRGWRGGSIRPLRRAVDRILALRQSPNLAH